MESVPHDMTTLKVAADIPCIKCAYDLRTLSLSSVCPECAHPVEASVRHQLAKTDVASLRRLRKTVHWLTWIPLILIVLGLAPIVLAAMMGVSLGAWSVSLPCATIVCVPIYLRAAFDFVGRECSEFPSTARSPWIHHYVWVRFVLVVLSFSVTAFASMPRAVGGLGLLMVLWLPVWVAGHARRLASRLEERQIARFASTVYGAGQVAVVYFLVAWPLFSVVGTAWAQVWVSPPRMQAFLRAAEWFSVPGVIVGAVGLIQILMIRILDFVGRALAIAEALDGVPVRYEGQARTTSLRRE